MERTLLKLKNEINQGGGKRQSLNDYKEVTEKGRHPHHCRHLVGALCFNEWRLSCEVCAKVPKKG